MLDFLALRHGRLQVLLSTERSLTSDSNPEAPKLIVLERVKDLKEALASSEFEPEQVNIKAAINAYESGRIGYTRKYTLIWAGQVVDTAATYGEFSVDRKERLNRYAEKYGAHWLWWESPLDIHPNDQFQAKGCQVIPRRPEPGGLGHFWITQVLRFQNQRVIANPDYRNTRNNQAS